MENPTNANYVEKYRRQREKIHALLERIDEKRDLIFKEQNKVSTV